MTAIWITAARRWAAIFAAIGFITLMDVPELRAQGLLILDSDLGILKYPGDFPGFASVFVNPRVGAPFNPTSMAFGAGGDLYVASAWQGCEIWRFDGKIGTTKGRFSPAAPNGSKRCDVLAFGPDGNIYTTGLNVDVVQRFDGTTGAFLGDFVTPGPEAFFGSTGLIFGPDDNLYVVSNRRRVLRYDGHTGAFLGTFVDESHNGFFPGGLVFGPDANLYVAMEFDCGSGPCPGTSTVLRYDPTGSPRGEFVFRTALTDIGGIVFGPDRRLYLTDVGTGTTPEPPGSIVRFIEPNFAEYIVPGVGFFSSIQNPRAIVFFPRPGLCPDGNVVDSDGDGLLDCWEKNGIDYDGDGVIDYKLEYDFNGDGAIDASEKADPHHKDLFVEVDWMLNHEPAAGVLSPVIASFANAPLNNPDNTQGVRLHILVDENAVLTDDPLGLTFVDPMGKCGARRPDPSRPDFDATKLGHFGTPIERMQPNWPIARQARSLVYHYSLWVHSLFNYSWLSGCGELPGNDFVVSIAGWLTSPMHPAEGNGTADHQAATFMHELGHNLGLHHGGGDDFNCKPNYLSIMNYVRSYNGSWVDGRPLDYSRKRLLTLDLNHLDEHAGIGFSPGDLITFGPLRVGSNGRWIYQRNVDASGAIDWDGSGSIDSNVSAPGVTDFNVSVSTLRCSPFSTILEGYDDWGNLNFNFRFTPDFAGGGGGDDDEERQVPDEPPSDADVIAANPDDDGDGVPNMLDNCPSVPNSDQADLNHNGIGDSCDPVNQPPTADAGVDQIVQATSSLGANVALKGSGTDPNNDPLAFAWTEGATALGAAPQITVPLPIGLHAISLTVNDGRGGVAAATTHATVGYALCNQYDPSVAKKAGSAYPIKVRLCTATGQNLSSASVVLHAVAVRTVSNDTPVTFDDTGNANPDFDFRYDASSASYIFNLSTNGLAKGTYDLLFTAGSAGISYTARFAVR